MTKIPFYLGNFFACFVKDSHARHVLRGWVNCVLYFPRISFMVKHFYGEYAHSIRFVRQHAPNRCVCLVNKKYYVKIFRNVSAKKLADFIFLTNYIRPYIDVQIPEIFMKKNSAMYVCKKLPGRSIYDFDKSVVIANQEKILNQISQIISKLQSIDINQIPEPNRFCSSLQSKKSEPVTAQSVLAHSDMNETNFLFDEDLNICALLDWDGLAITNNRNSDMQIFMKYWNRYKNTNQQK